MSLSRFFRFSTLPTKSTKFSTLYRLRNSEGSPNLNLRSTPLGITSNLCFPNFGNTQRSHSDSSEELGSMISDIERSGSRNRKGSSISSNLIPEVSRLIWTRLDHRAALTAPCSLLTNSYELKHIGDNERRTDRFFANVAIFMASSGKLLGLKM